jgi:alpha-D-ribose 1-methylphosphonate 5-triphosphate synthase subunit PhnG
MNMKNPRQAWMSLLSKAPAASLSRQVAAHGPEQPFNWLRRPEIGGVMVQGRTGGTGARFNVGEITVTRCSLQLDTGEIGHAVVQGRNKTKAKQAAVVDALMQSPAADRLKLLVLEPLAKEMQATKRARAAKAAATKVDFFTLARGED